MKKIILLLLSCSAFSAYAQKTSFAGNYKLDKEHTEFNNLPEWIVPVTMTVTQDTKKLVISRAGQGQTGAVPQRPDTLLIDGTAKTWTGGNGAKFSESLKWEDHFSISLDTKGVAPDGKIRTEKETWTFSDDNTALIVDRNVEQANGTKYAFRAYYTKS